MAPTATAKYNCLGLSPWVPVAGNAFSDEFIIIIFFFYTFFFVVAFFFVRSTIK